MSTANERSLSELIGHIEYRLRLSDTSHNDATLKAGYFFLPTDQKNELFSEYPLVVPQSLLKTVCDAARSGHLVTVHNYSTKNIAETENRCNRRMVLLELHHGGITIRRSENSLQESSLKITDTVLSLTQLQKIETCNDGQDQDRNQKNCRKDYFTVSATVDAISPIIAAVPTDPFALIELYEESETDAPMTAVAVLRGEAALVYHEGIQPGDCITLCHVRKQRWHVPGSLEKKGLKKLQNRTPTHVLVVDQANSVIWSDDTETNESTDESAIAVLPPLPSTTVPLTSLQGEVVNVQYKTLGKMGSTGIHVIEFISNERGKRESLYVTYYPISSSLLLGLRPGAVFRAVNVHLVPLGSTLDRAMVVYGACLRSSLTIMQSADDSFFFTQKIKTNEKDHRVHDEEIDGKPRKRSKICFPPEAENIIKTCLEPYLYTRVYQSYQQLAFRDHTMHWYNSAFENSKKNDLKTLVPSLDDIIHALSGTHNGLNALRSKKKKPKNKHRDPYAEFFDHACNPVDFTESASVGCQCGFSESQILEKKMPLVVELEKIRHSSTELLIRNLASSMSSTVLSDLKDCSPDSRIRAGWTASIHLTCKDLMSEISESNANPHQIDEEPAKGSTRVCTGGILSTSDKIPKSAFLRDFRCQLPICGLRGEWTMQREPYFGVVDLESVIVSCICLGEARNPFQRADKCSASEEFTRTKQVQLPHLQSELYDKGSESSGPCMLFEVAGKLFISSVQLRCRSLQVLKTTGRLVPTSKNEVESFEDCLSIQECLRTTFHSRNRKYGASSNEVENVVGVLTRQRFKFAKIRGNCYNELMLTLAHAGDAGLHDPYTLQSIDFKLSVTVPAEKRRVVQRCIEQLIGVDRLIGVDNQVNVATAWWCIAGCARSSALVAGGWDEFQKNCDIGRQSSRVHVRLPVSAITQSEQGYVRVRCAIEDLQAYCVSPRLREVPQLWPRDAPLMRSFDYVGGTKFLPGMLDRLPRRRDFDRTCTLAGTTALKINGEIVTLPTSTIPSTTLSSLMAKACRDIKNRSKTALEPSLLQMIPNARLLSVAYCRAQAECSRCFAALCGSRGNRAKAANANGSEMNGIMSSVALSSNAEESFWHQPLPMKSRTESKPIASNVVAREAKAILRCPNGCIPEFASIKWECSGIIDDGTGQAKLYAERDAALMLLGSGLDVQAIEEGAWKQDGGLIFSKGVPTKSYVKQAIREAQILASQSIRTRQRSLNECDILRLLTPQARGEYLLQMHCRYSMEPSRRLHFFCRCKSLSDGAYHLNPTQLEQVSYDPSEAADALAMDFNSYSLFPLKLKLVDSCAITCSAKLCTSWEMVKELKANSL